MTDQSGGAGAAFNPSIITNDHVDAAFAEIHERAREAENLEIAREQVLKLESKLDKERAAVAAVEQSLAEAQAELAALEGA